MADGAKIKWREKNRLNRLLSKRAKTLDRRVEGALHLSGNYVLRLIREKTNVKSGDLRDALELGAVILTPHVVYITIYSSGKFGTEPYNRFIEAGNWTELGAISKAHNKGGDVGKHAFSRTFEDGVTLKGAMDLIRKTIFKN